MLSYTRIAYCTSKQICTRHLQENLVNSCIRFVCIGSNGYHSLCPIPKKESTISSVKSRRLVEYNHLSSSIATYRYYSDKGTEKDSQTLSNSEKLKKAVKEYGSTVVVFHVGISILSLGFFYVLVSSGVDLAALLQQINLSNDRINNLTGNAGTFVIAYAIHKNSYLTRHGIGMSSRQNSHADKGCRLNSINPCSAHPRIGMLSGQRVHAQIRDGGYRKRSSSSSEAVEPGKSRR
ncbi:hypothetical protein Trydic_g7906 [Trypoxylus dichotomus]